MKKVFIAIIASIGLSVPVVSQTVKIPVTKPGEKIQIDPAKPVAPSLKVAGIPKTFSKVPQKDKVSMGMKSAAVEKPKVTTPATPVVQKKNGITDKRYESDSASPVKKDGTPNMRYKKNRKGKSK